MMLERLQLSETLKTLMARDQEELSLLRFVLHCAQLIHRAANTDLSLGQSELAVVSASNGVGADVQNFLSDISEDSKKYLYGLVEALDIYQSIYGRALSVQNMSLTDRSIYEIKQIRDMCLQDGLKSIY